MLPPGTPLEIHPEVPPGIPIRIAPRFFQEFLQ